MTDPFDLGNAAAYREWRALERSRYPVGPDRLGVTIRALAQPTEAEIAAVRERVGAFNMALIRADPDEIDPEGILAFGRALGLRRTDANLFADAQAVSRITQTDAAGERGDYIPYTNKPLSWHTDGYYNAPEDQVRAWMLFCANPAREGGVNALLDHEMAYILLRDQSPEHIAALSHPETLTIPANVRDGKIVRAASTGPVFSVREGHLHMRYTGRGRNVIWRDTPATEAARRALDQLFSLENAFTFRFTHRLAAGEGIVSNNVLHNRSGFADNASTPLGRLLYRVRYRDRIALAGSSRWS